MKRVLTYGTFDLFHFGHIRFLKHAALLGDELIVGVSTDAFNEGKGKKSTMSFDERFEIVSSIKCVNRTIPEESWDQKEKDIEKFDADVLVMGDDWRGEFNHLAHTCDVIYLARTPGISTSKVRDRVIKQHHE